MLLRTKYIKMERGREDKGGLAEGEREGGKDLVFRYPRNSSLIPSVSSSLMFFKNVINKKYILPFSRNGCILLFYDHAVMVSDQWCHFSARRPLSYIQISCCKHGLCHVSCHSLKPAVKCLWSWYKCLI